MHAQHEADTRDDPTVTEKAGAPGGDGNHEGLISSASDAGNTRCARREA
jgi:hypothetical protein